jgi:membrane protease YdiL (CAAX protease family)
MLLLVFGTQLAVGVVIAIAVAVVVPRDQFTSTLVRFNGSLLLVGGGIALVMTWALAKAWAPAWLRDRTLNGIGPLALSPRLILTTALAGVALGSAFHLTANLIPVPKSFHLGPLADIADKGGGGRLAWAVVALLLAPAAEELLFRGLLLRGLTVSWGLVPAAVCVTLLFTGAHLTETLGYWPASVAIFCLSIATLTVRLRSGVLPAAVLHASYNLVLVLSLYTSRIV